MDAGRRAPAPVGRPEGRNSPGHTTAAGLRSCATALSGRSGNQRSRAAGAGPVYEFSWSPDGSRIVYRGDDFRLYVAATGEAVRRLTGDGRAPAWSPDGRLIAFVTSVAHVNNQGEVEYVAVVRPNGSGRTLLPGNGRHDQRRLSPDSRRLCVRGAGGRSRLPQWKSVTRSIGTGRVSESSCPMLGSTRRAGTGSPDGARIAYTDGDGSVGRRYRCPPPSSHLVARICVVVPDGRWIAVQGARVIEVVRMGGGRARR